MSDEPNPWNPIRTAPTKKDRYAQLFATKNDAEKWAKNLFEGFNVRISQQPDGTWLVEKWDNPWWYLRSEVKSIGTMLVNGIKALIVLLIVGFALSKCKTGSSNCYTEWDGRGNPTYCE